MANKLKQFWRYLNTSHGTHQKIIADYSGGHEVSSPEFGNVPNKTPLEKILITGLVVGISVGSVLYIRGCIIEESKPYYKRLSETKRLENK